VIVILIIAIVLAIVLPIVLKGDDEKKPEPPGPPVDPNVVEFNPYKLDETSVTKTAYKHSGVIQFAKAAFASVRGFTWLSSFLDVDPETSDYYYQPVNPKYIPDATNNKWATRIAYEFELLDNTQARLNMFDESSKG
jgi:hypothetical protein